jgi:hypothetical protein
MTDESKRSWFIGKVYDGVNDNSSIVCYLEIMGKLSMLFIYNLNNQFLGYGVKFHTSFIFVIGSFGNVLFMVNSYRFIPLLINLWYQS